MPFRQARANRQTRRAAAAAQADEEVDAGFFGNRHALDHIAGGGVFPHAIVKDHPQAGGLQGMLDPLSMAGGDQSGVGHHQHAARSQFNGQFSDAI